MVIVSFGLMILAILLAIFHTIITWNDDTNSEALNVPSLKSPRLEHRMQSESDIPVAQRENADRKVIYSKRREFWRRLKSGVYLTDLKILIGILFVYIVLILGTYVALVKNLQTDDQSKPFFIAYGVATGSDPLDFRDDFKGYSRLFGWVLFIRLLSWLLIPLIAAAALDAVYRINEERKATGQRALKAILRQRGQTEGLIGPELDGYVRQAYESIMGTDDRNASD